VTAWVIAVKGHAQTHCSWLARCHAGEMRAQRGITGVNDAPARQSASGTSRRGPTRIHAVHQHPLNRPTPHRRPTAEPLLLLSIARLWTCLPSATLLHRRCKLGRRIHGNNSFDPAILSPRPANINNHGTTHSSVNTSPCPATTRLLHREAMIFRCTRRSTPTQASD
jgi:hypothetical protein